MAYQNTLSILIQAQDKASEVIRGAADNVTAAQKQAILGEQGMQDAFGETAAKADASQLALRNAYMQGAIASTNGVSSARLFATQLDAVGQSAQHVGANLSKYVTLPVIAAAALSVKMAADFQTQMTKLVTSAGETESNLASVSAGTLQIARDTGTTTTELASALYTIESGGQHGANGLLVLKAAAEGAKAENSDLATVADAVTSVLQDYHLKASDAATVTTKLVAATSAGKTTFQELAAAMPAILPVASAAHVALSDILGDLASMTVHGMSAEQSAQNLSDVIRHMQNPTATQAKELALLNMTTTQLASDLQSKGLSGTLGEISDKIANLMPAGSDKVILQLKTALNDLSPQVRDLGMQLVNGTISSKDYAKAATALDPIMAKQATSFATLAGTTHRIGDQQVSGSEVLQNYGQALAKATGDATGLNVALMLTGENSGTTAGAITTVKNAANEAGNNVKGWQDIQQTFNFRMAQFKETLDTTAISVGTRLLPVLTTFIKDINDATTWFSKLSPWQKTVIGDTILFAAALGPVIFLLGSMARSVLAIIELGGAVSGFFTGFATVATTSVGIARTAVTGLYSLIGAGAVMGSIAVAGALADIALVAQAVNSVIGALNAMNQAKQAAASDQAYINSQIPILEKNAADPSKTNSQRAAAYNELKTLGVSGYGSIPQFATGGFTGTGSANDIAGIVHKGEYVVPANQVDQTTGTPKMGGLSGGRNVTIQNLNINNQVDAGIVVRQIGWQLQLS